MVTILLSKISGKGGGGSGDGGCGDCCSGSGNGGGGSGDGDDGGCEQYMYIIYFRGLASDWFETSCMANITLVNGR